MGLIREEIEFKGNKGELTINTLFDSGSTLSLIKSEFAEKLEVILNTVKTLTANTAGNSKVQINKQTLINMQLEYMSK